MKVVLVLGAVALLAAHSEAVWANKTIVKNIVPGVTLTQELDDNPPLIINVLKVDRTQPGVRVECSPGRDTISGQNADIVAGRDDVLDAASRRGAVAAVNGDFFPFTGDPLGVGIWNGLLYSEPYSGGRSAIGLLQDHRTALFDIVSFLGQIQGPDNVPALITGVNRPVSSTNSSDLVVYSSLYSTQTGGRTGGTEIVIDGVSGSLQANKLIKGTVLSIVPSITSGSQIPAGDYVLSAPHGGPSQGFLLAHLKAGDPVEFVCLVSPYEDLTAARQIALGTAGTGAPGRSASVSNRTALNWTMAQQAIGGGPRLVANGNIDVDGTQEGFDQSFISDPNPRTAIGVTKDGAVLLVTADGRQLLSKGVSLDDMARIMLRYGAQNAINLDGGGSTTMVASGFTLNAPSGNGAERPVADMVFVYGKPAGAGLSTSASLTSTAAATGTQLLSVSGPSQPVNVGDSVQLSAALGNKELDPSSPELLWQGEVGSGVGFVSQDGVFHAQHGGTGLFGGRYGSQVAQGTITVVGTVAAPVAYSLLIHISPDPTGAPNRAVVAVHATSSNGSPLQKGLLHVVVTGGVADQQDLTTDMDGMASVGVTWNGAGGSVTITGQKVTQKTVTYPG